jgi:uncharacterized heparinase superfamily protein
MGLGKLWNYNLQYFDFLLDEKIDAAERYRLLLDFSKNLLAKRVKLEPYPVSLRIINTLIFLSEYDAQDEEVELALKRQISYLENNLEHHILANHLLENIFALFVGAYALDSQRVFQKALKLLGKQLDEQLMPDGGHYECSPMYHCILLGKLLVLIDLEKQNPHRGTHQILNEGAAKMLGWIQQFVFDNQKWAPVNDAIHGVTIEPRVLEKIATMMEIEPKTTVLNESGYRKWQGHTFQLIIDVGNITPAYQPGHAHSDMLSFNLQANGRLVFIDMGTSTYEANARRQLERSTAAHNTVTIGNDNQSDVWGSFRVAKRAKIYIEKEESGFLSAWHNGYRKKHGAVHQRIFKMDNGSTLLIEDILATRKKVTGTAHFHLDNGIEIDKIIEDSILLSDGTRLDFTGADSIEILSYSQAIGFNRIVAAKKIEVQFSEKLVSKISM